MNQQVEHIWGPLGRILAGLMPEDAEVLSLLALMELQASRLEARTGPDGAFIPLTEQDRFRRLPLHLMPMP